MEFRRDLKLLVFDLDGTLIDLNVDWSQVRQGLGVDATEPLGAAVQRLTLEGSPLVATVTDAELAGLGERRVAPAVAQLLVDLAGRYRLAVLTRNSSRVARRALESTPLVDQIRIVGREECPRLKPAPDGLRMILTEYGVEPKDAALIGDTDHDVRAAAAAGAYSVVVRNSGLAYPPAGADHYIDELNDLSALLHPSERHSA